MGLSSVKSFWDDSGAEAHIAFQLCDIQGRLFVRSARKGWDSEKFVSFFMKSRVAEGLDSVYNRMQWAGEEYLLDETVDESGGSITPSASPLGRISSTGWATYTATGTITGMRRAGTCTGLRATGR